MIKEPPSTSWRSKTTPLVTVVTLVLAMFSAVAVTAAVAPAAVAATGPIVQKGTGVVTADALPTTQIDGVAWTQKIIGNRVYVGGSFETARPAGAAPGTSTVVRKNILAYDITTGTLITTFAPSLNSQAYIITASPDGSRIYVGGDFTTASGVARSKIAAFNATTGALITTFAPNLNGRVRAIVATGDKVYVGGQFTTANGNPRDRLAAFNATDGSLTGWNPGTDSQVYTMLVPPAGDKILVGGAFQNAGGGAAYGMAALDLTNGGLLPWNATNKVRDAGTNSAILQLTTDGTAVFGNGFVFGAGGNLEGIFSAEPNTGNINWIEDCHGDTYSNYPAASGVVYASSHSHYCGNVGGFPQTSPWTMYYGTAFTKQVTGTLGHDPYGYHDWAGTPSPSMVNWFPFLQMGTFTGQGQAGWTVTGNDQYVTYGGEFPTAGGKPQQGLVRFAVPSIAPKKMGPEANTLLKPKLNSFSSGTARITWQTTWDRDDLALTYRVVRDGKTTTPIYETTANATFWNKPTLMFTDTGLAPGSAHSYRVYAVDPDGNTLASPSTTITVAATGTLGSYAQSILDTAPSTYWRFGETDASTTTLDWAGSSDGVVGTGITRNLGSAVGDTNPSFGFNGDGNSLVSTPTATVGPDNYSAEMWIKTNTTSGGKILGFGSNQTGSSSSYDRHVYMDSTGHIWFGVYPNGVRTVTSPGSYNDNQWHQIVTSLSPAGMVLYVDGKKVASRADTTFGQGYSGYWRVGGDNIGGWPGNRSSDYFTGSVDDVSIYPAAITADKVDAHWVASGRTSTLVKAPSDAYGAAVFNADPTLYWRLGEPSGTTAHDTTAAANDGTLGGTFTRGAAGALAGVADRATTFSNNGTVWSNTLFTNPTTYSTEAWFKTATQTGGKIIGFGNHQDSLSDNYDRHVYMQDDGRLVFGTWTGQTNTITSAASYNDDTWHHVVATQSDAGMVLYVDGQAVGTNPQTQAQAYDGYWKVGSDPTWGSSSNYFNGTIDEAAVYSTALSAAQVLDHFTKGGGQLPNALPTAEFTSTVAGSAVHFDASQSADTDGTIASYQWAFGDGATATGVSSDHTFATPGTYSVTLTVKDNRGGQATKSHDVVIATPANVVPVAAFTSNATGLSLAVNGSTSSDIDGQIVKYSWDFGDGSSAVVGVSPTHVYTAAGDYNVSLTVTDNANATNILVRSVTVAPLNDLPTASFQSSTTGLAVTVNATASTDPDGTISGYAWDFGDNSTGTGVIKSHTYATAGTYTVKLTVTDNSGGTASVQQDVVISPVDPNKAPIASFVGQVTDRSVAVNGSASSDPDGTVDSYSWTFGTTGSATGPTAQYTFPAAGTYPVTLTVTDNNGATASKTLDFTVTDPVTSTPFITDQFARTVSNGWGSANLGGAWSTVGTANTLSVAGGTGVLSLPAAAAQSGAYLAGTLNTSSDIRVQVAADKNGSGPGTYVSVIGRRVSATNQYRARVRWAAGNRVAVSIIGLKGSTSEVQIAPEVLLPGSIPAGTAFNVRFQVSGTSPTQLKVKVWAANSAEPTDWLLTATDTTAALQVSGAFGVMAYLSSTATNAPVKVSYKDLSVRPVV